MKSLCVRFLDALYLTCIWVAGTAIFCMSLIIPWGVFSRYVLGTGSQWPEPIAILLMMVFTFMGGAAAFRANAHIAVTMLTDVLSPLLRSGLAWLVDALMLLACGFVAWYGARLCMETMGQTISELTWLPVGVTYLALPIGSAITFLFVLERRFIGPQDHRPLMRYEESKDQPEGAH
ncbi:TRAP transporter small permease [uncultured Limnohabitans sp.]|jgi:TRAP-type C4-dicarboxylate transport system permease small subunit|uniref:TRAP transporter small permease n=1 Tax=uncultured Limnohabitans sp. TaxID=768543 RepID=UPI00261DE868|nr:TRAP transporter small permease [uncultured Limnohabitans sp.]